MDILQALDLLWPYIGTVFTGVLALFAVIFKIANKYIEKGIAKRNKEDIDRDEEIKEIKRKMAICTPEEYKSIVAQVSENRQNINMITANIEKIEKRSESQYVQLLQTIKDFKNELKLDLSTQFEQIIMIFDKKK